MCRRAVKYQYNQQQPIHREISQSYSAKSRGDSLRNFAKKTLGEISDFNVYPRFFFFFFFFFFRKGCSAAKREKEFFSWADLFIINLELNNIEIILRVVKVFAS